MNMLNLAMRADSGTLKTAANRDANPILHTILQSHMPGNMEVNLHSGLMPWQRRGTSQDIAKQLMQERIKAGMSKREARQSIHDELANENYVLRNAHTPDNPGSLSPAEQQFTEAKRQSKAMGGNAQQSQDPTALPGWNPSRGLFDPVALANAQAQGSYFNQGANDIAQYEEMANLMGGMVPEQLRPLYDLMTQQRAQEMQNNLTLTTSQMQAIPYIQQMKDAAADWKTAQRSGGSSGGGLSALLNAAQGGSGTDQAGQAGSPSMAGLNGTDLSRQLLNQLSMGQMMGRGYSSWEKPVVSNSQMTYLRDFIPRSNKGWNQVPVVAQYLGATPYGQSPYQNNPYG
jgi:hypothetical protein